MDTELEALAEAHGVATWYEDWHRERRDVPVESVVAVLGLLGVEAGTPEAVRRELAAVRDVGREQRLPGTVVLREGASRPLPRPGTVLLEGGGERPVTGELTGDLPLGWHRLRCGTQEVTLVVVPRALPEPPSAWGWMIQLYALHSTRSWGMGDLGDLAEFTRWSGDAGAGVVLLNPLHAVTPVHPVPASPYSPSSRRFANPLYLRVEDTDAYARADPPLRDQVDALRPAAGDADDLIDYDAVWRAKRAALEVLWPLAGPVDLDDDPGRADFATYCALAERHGADWRTWPAELRRPDSPAVAAARAELADRVAFHTWLQRLCDEQLATANAAAGGMPVGIVHDLAVGIDPGGADGWLLQDVLAAGVHVGAPPDAFNQLGQDWGLAAWRPDRLVETGYAAYRDMLRRILGRAGGLRVDHIVGLWRLWWVPPGTHPADGTYVQYDPEAMLGILALEAHRAGAVVIGEDLGTVLPAMTKNLREQNMLGSAVLWFTRDWDDPEQVFIAPARWPRNALATVSTHDLPTAAGFLTGEHVRVRAKLDLLGGTLDEERERAADDRAQLLAMLGAEGLVGADPTDDEIVVAMHAALARTPCRLVLASLYDVLGEVRQPNLPGTVDQYPNWRMPLPATLEQIEDDPRVRRVAGVLRERAGVSPGAPREAEGHG